MSTLVPAWFGHFVLEGNRPATLTYPLFSIRGDLRMLKYALQGKMAAEVERVCNAKPERTANGAAQHEPAHVNA